jgi:phage virion morphogenesis protein
MDIEVDINVESAALKLDRAIGLLDDGTPLMTKIAGTLYTEAMQNFASEGRPAWVPLADSTKKERLSRNRGSSVIKILQDRGILVSSVSVRAGSDYAIIGAGGAAAAYAAIQQFGGTIERAPYSTRVRLRTDAKGNLLKNADHPNLAVFAKDSHKRARTSWHPVSSYSVTIPARPYLPFTGGPTDAVLQPEAEQAVLDVVVRMFGDLLD